MPDDGPTHPVEELLKRYAKARRAQGGDFALHEATRRRLQGEVARQYRAREPQRFSLLAQLLKFRGRLAFAGAVAAALVFAVWMTNSSRKAETALQLAKSDLPRDEYRLMERETADKKLAVASGPARALSEPAPAANRAKTELLDRAGSAEQARGPATVAQKPASPQPTRSAETLSLAEKTLTRRANSPATTPTPGTPATTATAGREMVATYASSPEPAAPGGIAAQGPTDLGARMASTRGGALESKSKAADFQAPLQEPFGTGPEQQASAANLAFQAAAQNQNAVTFYRPVPAGTRAQADARARSETSGLPGEPLTEFTVEVQGENVRFVDADRSVYDGVVGRTEAELLNEKLEAAASVQRFQRLPVVDQRGAARKDLQDQRNYYFRAAGSNLTLKKMVVVSGQLSNAGQTTLTGNLAPASATNRLESIEGTIRVGGTNDRPFRAYRLRQGAPTR